MNTVCPTNFPHIQLLTPFQIKSVWYGWASLLLAGGIAYGLAKNSISQDRAQRVDLDRENARIQRELRASEDKYKASKAFVDADKKGLNRGFSDSANASREAQVDPAATRHAPVTEGQRAIEKSKYEATEVWRSPKGGRLG
jgi:hypothetical protein